MRRRRALLVVLVRFAAAGARGGDGQRGASAVPSTGLPASGTVAGPPQPVPTTEPPSTGAALATTPSPPHPRAPTVDPGVAADWVVPLEYGVTLGVDEADQGWTATATATPPTPCRNSGRRQEVS